MLEVRISDGAPGAESQSGQASGADGDPTRLKYRLELEVPEEGVAPQDAAVFLGTLERALSGKLLGAAPAQRVIGPAPGTPVVSGVIDVVSQRAGERRAAEPQDRPLEAVLMAELGEPATPHPAPAAPPKARRVTPTPVRPPEHHGPVNLNAVLSGVGDPRAADAVWHDDVGFITEPPTDEWTGTARVKRSRARHVVGVIALFVVLVAGAGMIRLSWGGWLGPARAAQPARLAMPPAPDSQPAPPRSAVPSKPGALTARPLAR